MLVVATPAWSATGNGVLTVDNNGGCDGTSACDTKPQPEKWDALPGGTIHINITAMGGSCTSGPFQGGQCTSTDDCSISAGACRIPPGRDSGKCSDNATIACQTDADCNVVGTCSPGTLECSGATHVIVKGHAGSCATDSDCDSTCGVSGTGQCSCDTIDASGGSVQACQKQWWLPATVSADGKSLDVCWDVDPNMCFTATVAYCDDLGLLASENAPDGTGGRTQSGIRAVEACSVAGTCSISGDTCFDGSACKGGGGTCVGATKASAIQDCEREVPSCTNEVGSYCCGLTQGAYGAPNSIATAACSGDCTGCGFIPAAACQGCDVFAGDPNATTAGIHGTKAVTIDNLATLQAYLPSGSTAGCFKGGVNGVGADTHYSAVSQIPDLNRAKTNSRGEGGGVLAGQSMAARLNAFLSSCPTPFGGSTTFTASGFGGFQIPADGSLVCTKTSGGDKVLGSGDDVCEAFEYPACTWGQTLDNVLAATNVLLATCTDSVLGCSATDLNRALDNANREFDNCGVVIACPASQTGAGAFACP
jgi:hypothetical protein